MTKSKSETAAEILASAKIADVILPETSSIITKRHTNSVHPVACKCLLCRERRFKNWSPIGEAKRKEELDWWQGD